MNRISNHYIRYSVRLEEINRMAKEDPETLIRETEQVFQNSVAEIAGEIREYHKKIIMLAGPSCAGKTTTAHLLAENLHRMGVGTVSVSLDDFFLGEGKAPLLENGRHDYESPYALNLPQMTKCLSELATENYSELPVFNFEKSSPEPYTRPLRLQEQDVVIVEGIHALNPLVLDSLPQESLMKLYSSVKQGISDQKGEVLTAQDIRLIRRVVRDHYHRGRTAEKTLEVWKDVCRGEELYIQPFKRMADITVNSLHLYEPCVFREEAEKLFAAMPENARNTAQVEHLRRALEQFEPLDDRMVPKDSLLQEFLQS